MRCGKLARLLPLFISVATPLAVLAAQTPDPVQALHRQDDLEFEAGGRQWTSAQASRQTVVPTAQLTFDLKKTATSRAAKTPTATPSPTATMAMPSPTGTSASDGAVGNSAAYGIWTPTAQDSCTKAEHDQFYVVGPDALRYPTWHPSVMTRPDGTTCSFGHEPWTTSIGITTPGGSQPLGGINLLFDVEDAIRYFYPGQPNNIGYFQDLCYETLNGNRQFRGGLCNGIPGLTWDSPQSWFRDINRGVYLKPGITSNQGGSTQWYTDPWGTNAQTSPWPGSIRQEISADNKNYAQLAGAGVEETANVYNHFYGDGNATVHAPN
jgi:hypothetical protein